MHYIIITVKYHDRHDMQLWIQWLQQKFNAVWLSESSLDHSSNNYNGSSKADNPEWVGGRGTPTNPTRKIHQAEHTSINLHVQTKSVILA